MVYATLIGDLVASKRHPSRPQLQAALVSALERVNAELQPPQPLEITVGDEFQGAFASPSAAIRASLMVRLTLLCEDHGGDSRYGLGYGDVSVFDGARRPLSQDGPGWWAAREAIERVALLSAQPRTTFIRTGFSGWHDAPSAVSRREASALDAFLIARDASIGRMSPRGWRLLLGTLRGLTQDDLGWQEGISQSAVSQHLRRSGAFAVDIAQRRLEEEEL